VLTCTGLCGNYVNCGMTSRDAGSIVAAMPDDTDTLLRRLREAIARRDGATRGSPEWDAAMDYVEDVERRLQMSDAEAVPA
jgi:hypothetical protein